MNPRIFIAIHYLELGGAEISLIGLLNAIDTSRYDVDLFIYSHRGELMKMIPAGIHLLPEVKEYAQIEKPIKEVLKQGGWKIALARLWAKFQFSRYVKRCRPKEGSAIFQYVFNAVTPLLPDLYKYGEYDLAISFLTPHNIVAEKVHAKKKIAWIHTDYTRISVDVNKELPVWNKFDKIVSISQDVTKTFSQIFPSLSDKMIEINNILSPSFVRKRAEEFPVIFPKDVSRVNLLSVGRYTFAKNYDNVPDICKRIRETGCNVYWYIIGYGGDEALIRSKIKEAEMEEYVILLGKKENPYPYMKACDIYVQPSRFEGNSVTVREAQMLCKTVIVTDYPTAQSQIQQGVDGVIVPLDNMECARGIVEVIKNRDLQNNLIAYLQTHDYGNEREVEKIYQLIDS